MDTKFDFFVKPSKDSQPGGLPFPFALLLVRGLVHMRQWEDFEDPPQRVSPQLVREFLPGVLRIMVRNIMVRNDRDSPLGPRRRLVFNISRDIPLGECIIVEYDRSL